MQPNPDLPPGTVLVEAECGLSALERPGDGPAIVFLHGIGSNAYSFTRLFRCMPDHLRLIAWNAPGYLNSRPPSNAHPHSSDYAEAVARLLVELNVESAHIVGHSLGTLIAASFTERAPDRVASLTLAAAACGYRIARGQTLPGQVAARIADLTRLGPAEFAHARAPRLVFEPESNADIVALVEAEMARVNPDGYAQAVHMLAAGDLVASMANVRLCPNFILGAEDVVTPRSQTEAAAHAWAESHGTRPPIEVIERAGHAAYVQLPEAFAHALLALVPALRDHVDSSSRVAKVS